MSRQALLLMVLNTVTLMHAAELPPVDPVIAAAERSIKDGAVKPALRQLILAGDRALREGHPATGLQRLEAAARLGPDHAAAQAALGQAYISLSKHHSAIPALEKALALGAPEGPVLFLLAGAYWETGALAEADRSYTKLWQAKGPQAQAAAAALGSLRIWSGDAAGALAPLQSARKSFTTEPLILFDLARALEDTGSLEAAERIYKTLEDRNAQQPLGLLYRHARILARLGRTTEAAASLELYRVAYSADQRAAHERTKSRAALDYGWTLIEAGDYDRAAAHFASLPPDAEATAGKAQALVLAGRGVEARRLLERALLQWPEDGGLRQLRATLGETEP